MTIRTLVAPVAAAAVSLFLGVTLFGATALEIERKVSSGLLEEIDSIEIAQAAYQTFIEVPSYPIPQLESELKAVIALRQRIESGSASANQLLAMRLFECANAAIIGRIRQLEVRQGQLERNIEVPDDALGSYEDRGVLIELIRANAPDETRWINRWLLGRDGSLAQFLHNNSFGANEILNGTAMKAAPDNVRKTSRAVEREYSRLDLGSLADADYRNLKMLDLIQLSNDLQAAADVYQEGISPRDYREFTGDLRTRLANRVLVVPKEGVSDSGVGAFNRYFQMSDEQYELLIVADMLPFLDANSKLPERFNGVSVSDEIAEFRGAWIGLFAGDGLHVAPPNGGSSTSANEASQLGEHGPPDKLVNDGEGDTSDGPSSEMDR